MGAEFKMGGRHAACCLYYKNYGGAFVSVKMLARHLTVDLYNCKTERMQDSDMVKANLQTILREAGYQPLEVAAANISEDHFTVLSVFEQGHIALHAYMKLRYVAIDIFLCKENAEPEHLFKVLRSFFKPDKIKTTLLKRGDFGKEREIKPKTKTRVAPLRKIHNTGAKVIRILARRKNQ